MDIQNNSAPYYFHQGTNFTAYNYLGCNLEKNGNKYVYSFRTWAPGANAVSIVSDFFGWDNPVYMTRVTDGGIFEYIFTTNKSIEKQAYKYRIERTDRVILKGDPYARFSRGGADGASLVFTSSNFKWQDSKWFTHRKKTIASNKNGDYLATPINIYELHFGSFVRHENGSYYTYREMADVLVPYVKHMGYTHVEFLPLAEHPYDGSWGYQVGAFYAPTSRFGDPDDFRYLINELHKNGVGIILDWVPAHFPKDAWGLYEFDGGPLYEYQGKDRQESKSWGTRFFDLGREEIQSFLISNALYFFREFHIDGLRVDAVASMLYLDYDRDPGEWFPNCYGGKENLEAIAFFKKLNTAIYSEFSDVLMIAEESTSFAKITHPVSEGGLGFNLKWNMGWANDFYDYIKTDPYFRKYKHKALNFPLLYAFNENYVMPITHDEVVHGKLSLVNKMHGHYEDKFRQMRASLLLMMSYPGKKLLFMGTEFGQFREWNFDDSLEWFMLDYPNHKAMSDFTMALNTFYLEHKEMWELDFTNDGFEWIFADAAEQNLVAYKRKTRSGKELIFIINFSGGEQTVDINLKRGKWLDCVFATTPDAEPDRIWGLKKEFGLTAEVTLPKFSGAVFVEKKANNKIKI